VADASKPVDALSQPDASQTPAPPKGEVDAATPPPAAGPCDHTPNTHRLAVWPQELVSISHEDALWLDVARRAVLDISDPAAPRLRSRLDTDGLSQISPLTERRVLAVRARDPDDVISAEGSAKSHPDQLLVIGFDDPDAPKRLTRVDIPGEIALVAAVEDDSTTRVFVLSDEIERRCFEPTKQSYLYTFALEDDTLVQLGKLDLGDDVAVAERRGNYLVLIDGTYYRVTRGGGMYEPSLRVVELTGREVPVVSKRTPGGPLAGASWPALVLSVTKDVLTTIARDWKASGLRFTRYQLDREAAPRVLFDCSNDALDSHFEPLASVSVLGERVIVRGAAARINDGPLMQELIEVNTSCETQREEQLVGLTDVPNVGVAFEATVSDTHLLEVRLRNANKPGVIATASVQIAEGLEVSLDGTALTDVVAFEQGSEIERGLLGIATGWGTRNEQQLQLFSFSASTITPRGVLPDASRLAARTASGVAAAGLDNAFMTFDIDSAESITRAPRAKLVLPPLE